MRELAEPPVETAVWSLVAVPGWLRLALGACVLLAVYFEVDTRALLQRFSRLHVEYLLIGTTIAVPQLACLALRWRLTAARLGVALGQRTAFHEYAQSLLLNLLLPLGVLGDALRVARTARRERSWMSAVQSVFVERSIGQAVLMAWAAAVAPLWLGGGAWVVGMSFGALSLLVALGVRGWARRPLSAAGGVRAAGQRLCIAFVRVLGSPRAFLGQLALSSVILLSVVMQLYCALWALGLSLPLRAATRIFPFVLLSMTLPASVLGFGPREAASLSLYRAASLSGADGLALSLAFGVLTLLEALPWFVCWLLSTPPQPHPHAD